MLAAARLKKLVGAEANLFFQFSSIGNCAGSFGALLIGLGFAASAITLFAPLDVSLRLFRFGAFLCHVHSLYRGEHAYERGHGRVSTAGDDAEDEAGLWSRGFNRGRSGVRRSLPARLVRP